MPTKSQILGANPHTVLDLIDGWKTTVAALERHAETYLGYVQRPGGSTWEGRTAEAAQARARQDYVAVSRVRDAVDTAARQISNTINSTLMPPLANAKQIIENADASPGVHVNEDLSISYTPPQGTSKETADANTKTVAAAEAELKSESAKWWAAELDVAQQIRDAESTVVKDLNFGATLYDPHRAMPTSPKVRQPPGAQQAVFPPAPTQTPSGLRDLLGAGEGEPAGGPPGLQEMLFPGTGTHAPGKNDGAHQPGSLTEMLNQLSQPGPAPAGPLVPIPPADVEAFKAMARDLLRRDGVPPEQIEQRLNTFVTRAQEGYGLMGNRVPQAEGRGPGPGFGDGFADTWFGFEDMVHNLTGQGGPGAPGVLESWAGLAEGAAEAIVKPPIAGIVEDALNSPNPAYFLGGKTAEAAITAPSMMFGPEALAARGGLVEAEGAGGFGATGGLHLPHETPPIANGPHLPHEIPPAREHGPAELVPHSVGHTTTPTGEMSGHPPQFVGAHPPAPADTALSRHASPAPAEVPAPAGGGYQAPGHLPDGGGGHEHGGAADHHVTPPDHPHTPVPDHHPSPPEGPSGHSGHPGTGVYQPPEPATFDPGIADHYQYNSGDPHFPGEYPPRVPEPTFTRGDTEPGWAHINRGPDREWMPYQGQISGTERPPSGYLPEYVEINPETGSPVDYDGHTYRGAQEVFLEAKDGFRGMAFQPGNSYWLSRAEGAFGQAQRQLDALPEGAILEWHVSDPYGAAALRQLFERRRLFDVTVIYTPKL
ncbi:hypothetical protein C0J29_14485 [Mycobacterium paragordonae]|uniref:Tox-REase-5 domain-containing protein n=1 Tax=Mycobacterium paragordonae TaxID=1389713 RepID=A0ABQ1C591_9MYCO|nr:Tox-REase-5 domain-containing protein [Mycobacterium paragordonae]AYE95833.1 hypothetical protein C0J29_14485 [Mycobacterium paragordonae]GFG79128.1 hypothetical protein MPRG_24040 [Mycobacterium paragordonae]